MTMKFKESMKITLPAIVIFFSCAAYGQTQLATSEQLIGLRQTVETELPAPVEPQKIDLGKIGVVVASFRPEVNFDKPLTKGEAASQSAKQGAAYGANQLPSGLLFGALSRLFLMGVGAGVGAIAGSIKGESEEKIKETENALNSYLASVDIQGTLRDRLLAVSGEQTRYSCVPIDLKGPGTQGEEVTYDVVSSYQDIDTILEVGVGWCRLFGLQNKDVNPDLFYTWVEPFDSSQQRMEKYSIAARLLTLAIPINSWTGERIMHSSLKKRWSVPFLPLPGRLSK